MMMHARIRGFASAATAASFILAVILASPCRALAPTDFPNPIAGPGVEELKKSQAKRINRARREFLAGDHATSRKRLKKVADLAPSHLLEFQLLLQESALDDIADLRSFCEQHPGYAAAWITLSIAAETADLEAEAIATAERGGGLWPESPWQSRADDLYRRWVEDRISDAERLVDAGQSNEAMAQLQAARDLDPERRDAALIVAEILIANEQIQEAETILSEISDLPDAAFLQGSIAEDRRDWQTAMERYASLPAGFPGRDAALGRTKIQWRLTLLPNYARSAMTAEELTRGELAVALVSVRPELETLPGDSVPVMSDIVGFPGQREIITVVRLGIMSADRRDHRFFPDAPVNPKTVREAIQRTRALLGLTAPVWCTGPDVVGSSCLSISPTPSGKAVVQAVLDDQPGASR